MLTSKRYFHSNQNANDASMIIVPLCPQFHLSSKATTFNNNIIFLSISMHDINRNIILSCLGGLPNYMVLILEICEITNVLEDSKSLKKTKKKLWNIIRMSRIYLGHYFSLGWNYVRYWWVDSLHQVHCMQFSLRWEYHLVRKVWCTKTLLVNKRPKKTHHTLQYKNMRSMWIILNINMLKLKSNIIKTKFIQPSLNKCKVS
jgi:hypothetical protein